MPGLKGAVGGSGKIKAIGNIQEIMARRQKERGLMQPPAETEEILEKSEIYFAEEVPGGGEMYTKVFDTKVGARIQRRYEEKGEMPRVHREFYTALCEAMGSERKKAVVLQPILERLEIARSVSLVILACLEHYSYMKIKRIPGSGRLLEFERLK